MEKAGVATAYKLGDPSTSDILVRLRNREGRPEWFCAHSSILMKKSKFFADSLSRVNSTKCVEVQCSEFGYDQYVKLLKLLYLSNDLLLDSWDSVKTALGILQVAVALHCEEITQSCIQYLEAVPWEDKEEEEILKVVSRLGPIAMPILARIQPVDLNATKNVFLSAIRFATSNGGPCPHFADDLKVSAREQVEYMLMEDEDTPFITADEEVKSEIRTCLCKIFSSFEKELGSLLEADLSSETAEVKALPSLSDLDWMCNILPKMDLMKDFVSSWVEISCNILAVIQDKKFDSTLWGVKVKLIEVVGKVLDAVGFGNVILPTPARVHLLKIWLPYIRRMKPLLDLQGSEEMGFPYKMDEDLCQNIEAAIVSLVLALPSNDQADILVDWMQTEQVRYPDLSEAFEVWCYRTKAAKRRLVVGLNGIDNGTVSL
ncbi:PREDICTED: BTB/POZ domain-containing protein At3g05675-like [Nelumbo nucifera]|uniref:BTB/POZ domain-containing protein At3g05675-like n=1 Tax=Nelumbo nucifera TaxID=4432 RepID=A0A1U7Z4H1_NELNU|nr:PREDICTED: BTB/POZ domain-containing protein At3g05675-like [Nelumbo nucifera]XP_010247109.1 PREDICTED: BTB/POZ domain-containing protein At3g05675-like [Nelumbo nucifera]XP_010247111.1 PREDICTED: BTB/POZ domain-containing protein At3g05675-like [Nelumbo nucifera]XP_010247112.1 PREDICTED: BTB/POZ domain-containing protein At3g05675-like [Nelumbo nucifera]